MTHSFQPYVNLGSRTASSARGVASPLAAFWVDLDVDIEAFPTTTAGELQGLLPDLDMGLEVIEARLDVSAVGGKDSGFATEGRERWVVIAANGSPSAPSTSSPLRATTQVVVGGMAIDVPSPALFFSSAAAGALELTAGDTVPGRVLVRPKLATDLGRALLGEYLSSASTVYADTGALYSIFSYGGSAYTAGPAGFEQTFDGVTIATVNANNVLFLDSSDIGAGGGSIPTALAGNTPDAYRLHPSVFMPRGTFSRGVMPAGPAAASDVTTAEGAATLLVANYEFSHSRWGLQIDGTDYDIIIDHDGQGDLMRPRDIWANVLLSRIASGSLTAYSRTEGVTNVFAPAGDLHRLNFIQRAEFLDGYSETTAAPFSVYAQAGNPATA